MKTTHDTRIARGIRMESSLWRFLDKLAKKERGNASAIVARLVRQEEKRVGARSLGKS